ncbi:hypothetical protein [Amycolatopsis silviterrae]|uniref:Uncharacterized protein n=1 Tax=Amycolatopsis silviterrae TaxID=1656914 RepID=A0ABW5H3W7_9PSEU
MTLRPTTKPEPEPDDDQSPDSDGRLPEESEATSETNRTLHNALSSWSHTWRLIAITVTVLGMVITGIWLLRVNVELGPLRVIGR